MPTETVTLLHVVLASPSDVQAERDAVGRVCEELNRGIARDKKLRIELHRWEIDAHPGFHTDGPQALIDGWLRIEDSDLLVGIFWKKFGTPTQDAESGTEHEFQLAYEIWKKNGRPQIMMYFNEKPFRTTNTAEGNQMLLVVKFKENFPKEGLWWPYNGRQNFENLFRQHLTSFIRKFTSETTPVARGKGVQPEYDDPKWLDEEANRLDVENQRLRDETPPR
jgi:hypothetical protein